MNLLVAVVGEGVDGAVGDVGDGAHDGGLGDGVAETLDLLAGAEQVGGETSNVGRGCEQLAFLLFFFGGTNSK